MAEYKSISTHILLAYLTLKNDTLKSVSLEIRAITAPEFTSIPVVRMCERSRGM